MSSSEVGVRSGSPNAASNSGILESSVILSVSYSWLFPVSTLPSLHFVIPRSFPPGLHPTETAYRLHSVQWVWIYPLLFVHGHDFCPFQALCMSNLRWGQLSFLLPLFAFPVLEACRISTIRLLMSMLAWELGALARCYSRGKQWFEWRFGILGV